MKFSKLLMIGLFSVGAIATSALPGMARPGFTYSEANVRSGPSINARRIDGLPKGTPLEILRVHRGWYYVRSIGQLRTEGWMSVGVVDLEQNNRKYITLLGNLDDVINIRSTPSLGSRIQHTGAGGDLVEVSESKFVALGQGYGRAGYYWYYITYPNGASGWVRGDLIAK
jgi:uncharacterized protein YgiM (DUF1202 family)